MTRRKLTLAIIVEIERVFGVDGFSGEASQYEWLLENYKVTEEEDVKWQFIIDNDSREELNAENEDDAELIAFLDDDKAVIAFLKAMLDKYQSNTISVPKTIESYSSSAAMLTKRGPDWVTKTNVTDYARCPYAFWLLDTGAVNREELFGTVERALVGAGVDHETRVLEAMPELPSGLTVEQMRARARYVYGGPTVENAERRLAGRPDGIDLDAHAPIEIKNRLRALPLDKLELAFYWLLLEPFRTKAEIVPAYGWVSLGFDGLDEELERVQLTDRHFKRVEYLIDAVREARANGVLPRVCECFICLSRPEVQDLIKQGADVALVLGVGPARANSLSGIGIRTVHELSEADPDSVAERMMAHDGTALSPKMVIVWQHHARALRDKKPVRFSSERFERSDFIALDLEYDTMAGVGEVWLVGALVWRDGKVKEVLQAVCEGRAELKNALVSLAKLLQKNPDLPIVTWNGASADLPNLEAAAAARRVKIMQLVGERHIDLYRLTERSLRLPIPRLDLKSVGDYLGVKRKSKISGGFEAVMLFNAYCMAGPHERKRLSRALLAYNREDLEALRMIAVYLGTP